MNTQVSKPVMSEGSPYGSSMKIGISHLPFLETTCSFSRFVNLLVTRTIHISSLSQVVHTCHCERVTFDGHDGRECEEEMLPSLPSHELRPGLAEVQGDLKCKADGDRGGVLGQELDMCRFLVRGWKLLKMRYRTYRQTRFWAHSVHAKSRGI